MKLKQGDVAPLFSLQSTSGKEVDLISLRGSKVLLYFYPKDDTPGCTIEACEFRDLNEKFFKYFYSFSNIGFKLLFSNILWGVGSG